MRRFNFHTLLCAITLLGLFAGTAQAQNKLPWTVQSISGDARHEVNGTGAALAVGTQIGIGSKVSTGAGARVILARGDERMTMSPGSEISIPAETGNMLTRIVQNLGTLLLKVQKRPDRHFEVATPYLAAVVKGTTFTVSVDGQGSAVHVVEGLVQIDDAQSGQSGLVRPGQTGVVSSKPGGGMKISGGKASGAVKKAAAKKGKDALPAAEKAKNEKAADNSKGKQATKNAVKAATSSSGKGKSGLAISKALGTVKIDISAVTNGFVRADVGKGKNAGSKQGKGSENNVIAQASDNSGNGNANANSNSGNGNGNSGSGNSGNGNSGSGNSGGGNSGGGNSGGGNSGGGNGNGKK